MRRTVAAIRRRIQSDGGRSAAAPRAARGPLESARASGRKSEGIGVGRDARVRGPLHDVEGLAHLKPLPLDHSFETLDGPVHVRGRMG